MTLKLTFSCRLKIDWIIKIQIQLPTANKIQKSKKVTAFAELQFSEELLWKYLTTHVIY